MVNRVSTSGGAVASSETSTRERVLRDVSTLGPITTSALVERVGLTETAVRRHVENLLADGLIEEHQGAAASRRRGRPARSFVVSERGHAHLRSGYEPLASQAVSFLAEHGGRPAVRALADQWAADLAKRYAHDLPDGTPRERAAALVAALNHEGYAASARPVGGRHEDSSPVGVQLCQGHCPVQQVAAQFPEFCDAEAAAFSELLGVHVQRLATLAQGDHVCTTFVPAAALTSRAHGIRGDDPSRHDPAHPLTGRSDLS